MSTGKAKEKTVMANEWKPDFVVHPREHLKEMFNGKYEIINGTSEEEVRKMLTEALENFIENKIPFREEFSKVFSRVTGISSTYWTNLVNFYENSLKEGSKDVKDFKYALTMDEVFERIKDIIDSYPDTTGEGSFVKKEIKLCLNKLLDDILGIEEEEKEPKIKTKSSCKP